MRTELDHLNFLHACQEIGGIAECNSRYSDELWQKIEEYNRMTGRRPIGLTLSELLALHKQTLGEFNQRQQVFYG